MSSELGAWIRESRKKKRWTQAAVGTMLGVSQAQVSQWETGKNMPDTEELRKLEVAFQEKAPIAPAAAQAAASFADAAGGRSSPRRQAVVQPRAAAGND